MKFISKVIFGFMVPFILLLPSVAKADHLLFRQETSFLFRGESASRAHNIRLAASKINGTILNPGQEFSYNEVVGPRSYRAGFRRAPVIRGGRLEDDFGGGVCQVAGTLYAAVLFAGLQITEEHNHSRLSSYLGPGLDTTVVYPSRDFRFINSLSSPVRIVFEESEPGILSVELWSTNPSPRTSIDIIELDRVSFRTRRTERCDILNPGMVDVIERGTPYVRIVRRRSVAGTIEEREIEYRSSDRIVHYCPRERLDC